MDDELKCWKCGADVSGVDRPLRRAETCAACTADLHVCHMCRHFDPDAARGCREPVAEPVRDRTRANFCGWFQVGPRRGAGAASERARGDLEALFGMDAGAGAGSPGDAESARAAFDALFDDPDKA